MRKMLIIRSIVFLMVGAFIIIFNSKTINYLSLLIGIFMIITSLVDAFVHLLTKDYKEKSYTLYTPFVIFILALLILFTSKNDIVFICLIWGVIAILQAGRTINECVYNFFNNKKYIISLLESIISMVLAIMLIINPLEHVQMHLIILGLEIALSGLRIIIKLVYAKKNPKIMNEEYEKINNVIMEIEEKDPDFAIKLKSKNLK